MGALDTVGKEYFSDNSRFADAFNYLIYEGKPVIKADELRELDTTQIAIPYGNGANIPIQKYRDLLKLWEAKTDEDMIYVLLGGELQGSIHYGMPVKDGLYDMIGYSRQIEEAGRSYRKKDTDRKSADDSKDDEGNLVIENGTLKIKLTSEEFLSGFRKGDKLIPIVTAVIYLGSKPWDGPMSLHDMMDFKDEKIRQYVPDYHINLISPVNMDEADIKRFQSDLAFSMEFLKHQEDRADKIIEAAGNTKVSGDTARFLNVAGNLEFEIEEKEGGVDMCAALDRRYKEKEITGVIKYMKLEGKSDDDIISKIIEMYQVTKDYVVALLTPQPQEP